MALRLGWFSTPLKGDSLTRALTDAAKKAPPTEERFALHQDERGTAVIVQNDYVCVPQWAQAVSLASASHAVSFFAFEGAWTVHVFDAGEHVLFLDSHAVNQEPLLGGDLERASALLGTSSEVIKRFHRLLVHAFDTGERELAFPGDEFSVADEWGHLALAAHCTIATFPSSGDGEPFEVRGGQTARTWHGLPELLSLDVCPPDTVPRWLKYRTFQDQRRSLFWADSWHHVRPILALAVVDHVNGTSDPGLNALARWLRAICLSKIGEKDRALIEARALIREWLGPSVVGSVNQYLGRHRLENLLEALVERADSELSELAEELRTARDPEIALPEGDHL